MKKKEKKNHIIKFFKIFVLCFFVLITGVLYSCSQMEEIQAIRESSAFRDFSEEHSKSLYEKTENETEQSMESSAALSVQESSEAEIFVYVCGFVHSPQVVKLKEGDRIEQAVELAGGLREEAAKEFVNLARRVSDGERVYIPGKEEISDEEALAGLLYGDALATEAQFSVEENYEKTEEKVNINTAEKDELMQLTGIGEKRAQDILDYRQKHGSFKSIEEIKSVPGIKDGAFDKIKGMITV